MAIRKNPPKGFEKYLSEYKVCAYDSNCGEPVMWGFVINKHLGKEQFSELKQYGDVVCIGHGVTTKWCLVTSKLTRAKAKEKYKK